MIFLNFRASLLWLNEHVVLNILCKCFFFLLLFLFLAGTSLLRWAKTEENTDIRDCIHRLYDVNLMWATVQKEYIEQVWHLSSLLHPSSTYGEKFGI